MIKLIACDVDGTLLRGEERTISEKLFEQIRELKKMGVLFVAASGRQYFNLRYMFAPVKDEIGYISENGALLKWNGETLHKVHIEESLAIEIMHAIWNHKDSEILLSGEETSYIKPKDPGFYGYMTDYVKNSVTLRENIFELSEPAIKLSVFDKEGIEKNASYWQAKFSDRITVVTSGFEWLDFIPDGGGKDRALEILLKQLEIKPEECMAFGDNDNDVGMLRMVGYGYAVSSAKTAVKEVCRYETERVEDILDRLIEKMKEGKEFE